MKPWCRFALVLFAYGMALLHTAIPHHHLQTGGDASTVLVRQSCSLPHSEGGILQRALSTDLGIGHLETFNKESDTPLLLSSGPVSIFTSISFIPDSGCELLSPGSPGEYIDVITRWQRLFSAVSFRGPPLA